MIVQCPGSSMIKGVPTISSITRSGEGGGLSGNFEWVIRNEIVINVEIDIFHFILRLNLCVLRK